MTSQIEQQASGLQGHLPECPVPEMDGLWGLPLHPEDAEINCICDRLRACEQRERDLWERVAAERIADLKACNKPDDCHARADSIEVLLDDVAYYREGKP